MTQPTPIEPSRYQHFIFDLDGTLVDSASEIHEAASFICNKYGLSLPSLAYIRTKTGSPPGEFFLDHGCEPSQAQSLVAEFRQHLADYAGNPASVYPDVHDVLLQLSRAGRRISLATTKPTKLATILLDRYGLLSFFSHVQGTDPPLKHKPNPDIVLACIALAPSLSSVMVGDTTFDLEAAERAGIDSIGVGVGAHGLERLRESDPSFLINHMSELLAVVGFES
jgi:HAD superfamily hydrolase (TIGR01549 family)